MKASRVFRCACCKKLWPALLCAFCNARKAGVCLNCVVAHKAGVCRC